MAGIPAEVSRIADLTPPFHHHLAAAFLAPARLPATREPSHYHPPPSKIPPNFASYSQVTAVIKPAFYIPLFTTCLYIAVVVCVVQAPSFLKDCPSLILGGKGHILCVRCRHLMTAGRG